MTDVFDRAQEHEAQDREDAIASQRARNPQLNAADWDQLSAKWCEGPHCGVRIPDARRKNVPGVRLCIDCKAREEQKERQRR